MSERHFRRLRDRYEAEGAAGLVDRRLGRASGRRAPLDQIAWVLEQYRTRYWDFNGQALPRALGARPRLPARLYLDQDPPAGGRSCEEGQRARGRTARGGRDRPCRGCSCSRTARPTAGWWIWAATSTSSPPWTTPRARSSRPSWSRKKAPSRAFAGFGKTIEKKGLFCAFYTDRRQPLLPQPQGPAAKVDKGRLTQVGRALVQLGIEHIPSYSPEARGRIERLFGTLQGRLPQELRLAGIAAMDEANRYIAETFLLAFNDRFSVPAAGAGSAFLPYVGRALADILAIQDGRQVQNDNTVRYKGPRPADPRAGPPATTSSRPASRSTNIPTPASPSSMDRAASRATTRRESCSWSQTNKRSPESARRPGPWITGLPRPDS